MSRSRLTVAFAAAAWVAAVGLASAADIAVKAPPRAAFAPVPWLNVFGGFAIDESGYFGDAGAVVALNRNLNQDGALFRIRGGAGHYEYNRTPVLEQGVSYQVGEAMIGYQTLVGNTRFTGYVGVNVEHHDNPDPLAKVAGTKWGIKGQGEMYTQLSPDWYFLALGTLSSAWTSYFALAKVGYRVAPGISIGPEGAALGNDRFDAMRAGAFIAFDTGPSAQIIVSGGYSWDTNRTVLNDHSGAYGTIHLRALF
jgi:hypothetical protein